MGISFTGPNLGGGFFPEARQSSVEKPKRVFVFGGQASDEVDVAEMLRRVGRGRLEVKTADDLNTRNINEGFDAYVVADLAIKYFRHLASQLNRLRKDKPNVRIYRSFSSGMPDEVEPRVFDREYNLLGETEAELILRDLGVVA